MLVAAAGTVVATQVNGHLDTKKPVSCDPATALDLDLEYDNTGLRWYASDAPFAAAVLTNLVSEDEDLDVRPALAAAGENDYVEEHWFGGTKLKLVATAHCAEPVVLKNIRTTSVHRDSPLSGGVVVIPPQGSPEDVTTLGFDLDRLGDNTAYVYAGRSGLAREAYFDSKSFSLSNGEAQVFEIHGLTQRYYVTWQIAVDVEIQGKSHSYTLGVHGTPIRSTARASHYTNAYVLDETADPYKWVAMPGTRASAILAQAGP